MVFKLIGSNWPLMSIFYYTTQAIMLLVYNFQSNHYPKLLTLFGGGGGSVPAHSVQRVDSVWPLSLLPQLTMILERDKI